MAKEKLDTSPNWRNAKTTTTYCLLSIFIKNKFVNTNIARTGHNISPLQIQNAFEGLRSCFVTHGLPGCIVNDVHKWRVPWIHIRQRNTAYSSERVLQLFKEPIKRMQPAKLQLCVKRWLANCRLTPHSTTNRSPPEMLLRRRPKRRWLDSPEHKS